MAVPFVLMWVQRGGSGSKRLARARLHNLHSLIPASVLRQGEAIMEQRRDEVIPDCCSGGFGKGMG